MKIAVIGGTGRTGMPLVEELLRRGHEVTVLARTPAKLGALADRVTVVTGTSTDAAALDQLLAAGVDAVVSTLGPSKGQADVCSRTAGPLIAAMHAHGVRRYVGVSGAGMDVPGDQKGGRDKAISFLIQKVGGAIAADKRREYELFADSDIDFSLARPPRLLDGPATGRYVSDAHTPGRSSSIKRADLAAFLADTVEQGTYVRQAPFVSGA
jgi:putative NADH-flavin reductase